MSLSVGIVGLPNVGKSTTFNALIKAQNAQSGNYPFCTIEPNRAVVPVPDYRLLELARIVNPQKLQYSTIEFVDIAGLVRGASKGEGLGNQFLSNIREVDLILHVVRCFEDSDISHVEGKISPINDIDIIELELVLSDLGTLNKRIDKINKTLKSSKDSQEILDLALNLKSHFESGMPARSFSFRNHENFIRLDRELRFLSNKDIIYCANVNDDFSSSHYDVLRDYAAKNNSELILINAKLEEEMIDMTDDERADFLSSIGIKSTGLEQIIKKSFAKLNLISYFTAGVKEVRSWTIENGTKAPQAAGVIHNDFEKGFIRAEIIAYDDFIRYQSEVKCKEAGVVRIEGKNYIIKDGDIVHFRFNV